jgi:phosphate transport system substrate-binding protein
MNDLHGMSPFPFPVASEDPGLLLPGFASRAFTVAEKAVAGVELPLDVYGQLAWDAIVAIVHLDNPLVNVNADLLKRIYEKASSSPIRTWAEALTAEAAI